MNVSAADAPARWLRRVALADDRADELRHEAMQMDSLVRETALSGIARRVLVVGMSQLPADLRQPHHLRLAQEAIAPLTLADRARVFQLPNDDIAVIWRGAADLALRQSVAALRHLIDGDASEPDDFARQFSLPGDAACLRGLIADSLGAHPPQTPARKRRQPLDGTTLAALEAALARADVSRFARRRAVCAETSAGFRLRWEQRTLSIAELAETLVPDHDVLAEPWLFLRLTRTLDRRMLSLLAAPDELRGARPFSLALNVASILSPDFLRFDAALPGVLRGQVTLDLLPADVLTDPSAFLFARDFSRARRYRLMLRRVTASLLDVLPCRHTGVDLVQLDWSPELANASTIAEPAQIVLARADTRQAVEWGRSQGITLFQGRAAAPSAGLAALASG